MISEGPTYDEMVSGYSCRRNDPLPYTPSRGPICWVERDCRCLKLASTIWKQTETGVEDFITLNLPSSVELMALRGKVRKTIVLSKFCH